MEEKGPAMVLEREMGQAKDACLMQDEDLKMFEALLGELFRSGALDAAASGYFSFNAASAALHRKLGFRELFRHTVERRGETVEVVETLLERRAEAPAEREKQA